MAIQEKVPGVARVQYKGTFENSRWANVFHVGTLSSGTGTVDPAPWTQADIDILATQMRTLWTTHFRVLFNNACTLTETNCQDLSSEFGVTGIDTTAVPGNDADTTVLTLNAAVCISWKEAMHYRGGHLRTYLCPPPAGHILNSTTWDPDFVTAVVNAAGGFRAGVRAMGVLGRQGTASLVGVHRYRDKITLTPPVVTEVVSESVDNRVDSMRRRLGPDR